MTPNEKKYRLALLGDVSESGAPYQLYYFVGGLK